MSLFLIAELVVFHFLYAFFGYSKYNAVNINNKLMKICALPTVGGQGQMGFVVATALWFCDKADRRP